MKNLDRAFLFGDEEFRPNPSSRWLDRHIGRGVWMALRHPMIGLVSLEQNLTGAVDSPAYLRDDVEELCEPGVKEL